MAQLDIQYKCELAALRHLNASAASLAGVTIHAGMDEQVNTAPVLPRIVCNSTGAENYPPYSDAFWVDLEIIVETNAHDSTATTHNQRVGFVREQFVSEFAGLSMSALVSDFAALGVVAEHSTMEREDGNWITRLPFRVFCRDAD